MTRKRKLAWIGIGLVIVTAALGIAGTNVISPGDPGDPYGGGGKPVIYTVTFTAPASARGQTYAFKCTASPVCGTGHDGMVGTLHVN